MQSASRDSDNTGKRSAARINSGLPVDDSGPGLRVGPTAPATADRTSEACPPDSEGSVSQSKSRRESESGALRTSEARLALRSEAEQRSSLVLEETNRYTTVALELHKRGRKHYCGLCSLRGRTQGEATETIVRLDCKTWDCAYCGPRKAYRYKQAIRKIAEREELSRFLTLTLDPSKIEGDPVRYLRVVFSKFRVYLYRKHGKSIKYITVLEFHKSGIPHLHVLLDRYIEQQWISESWSRLGGGKIVHITQVDVRRIANYLAKYLTKDLMLTTPKGTRLTSIRRVTTSRSLHLNEKQASETTWKLDNRSIFKLFAIYRDDALDVELDEEDFIRQFVYPTAADVPHWLKHRVKTNVNVSEREK
jgi:hypothetical protein